MRRTLGSAGLIEIIYRDLVMISYRSKLKLFRNLPQQ